ncbi:reticulon-like protein B11 isoform X1 [Ipomoea triloba]|uniref:reticulon-like protein B11 isoform X1 n=1 Tax=Ipomoea triloba TaxID=35885 RepID=UPI00125DF34E|nr:reticulon-like protein B11 isoform X1 [Ipomoea triloba]
MVESRQSFVHHALGGGAVADVLLWRRWYGSVTVLVGSTFLWFLFERAGYNLLSFVANVLLLLVLILFFWAKSASLLNRPLPPLPDMEVSEEFIANAGEVMRVWVNHVLTIAHDIAIGGNIRLFVQVLLDLMVLFAKFHSRICLFTLLLVWQVAFGLWVISYVGSFFNFLTLVYLGVIFSLAIPPLYEKYQDQIDDKLILAHNIILSQYKKIDDAILKKIPMHLNKEKKIQ